MNTSPDPRLPNFLSFSGGKTSGYMLRREIDKRGILGFNRAFTVIFENTGKEHDATLDFVHQVGTRWGVPIIWLEYTRVPAVEIDTELVPHGKRRKNLERQQRQGEYAHWWKRVTYETAARYYDKRGPFDELLDWANVLPNVQSRMCSVQLKLRTRDRYLRANGIGAFNAYIGIRKDEEHRKHEIMVNIDQHENPIFPLCDDDKTKEDVNAYWDSQPFTLNLANHEGNCRLCYLKARWKRVRVAKDEPKSVDWWIRREDQFKKKTDGDGAFFRKGQSFQGVLNDSQHPEFEFVNVLDDEDVACSCAVGGYRHKEEDL